MKETLSDEILQRAIDAHAKHNGSLMKTARELSCAASTVTKRVRDGKARGLKPSVPVAPPKRRSETDALAAFRATYDQGFIIPRKIEAALKNLGKDWCYEADFTKAAGISPIQLVPYKEQFADYHFAVTADGRKRSIWCGTKEFAAQLRQVAQR